MTDAEIVEFAREFRQGILGGRPSAWMCAAVCLPLAGLLRVSGVPCECVESDLGGMNHFWIKMADGRALDPTGDQFWEHMRMQPKMPDVYLGPPLVCHCE